MKRKVEEEPKQLLHFVAVKKKLRSKLPRRRRRFLVSPPILNSRLLTAEELSCECDSSRASSALLTKRRRLEEAHDNRDYYADVQVSESSCVESCSEAVSQKKLERNEFCQNEVVSELKRGAEDSETVNKSEISTVLSFSGQNSSITSEKVKGTERSLEISSNDVVSVHSVLESEKTVQRSDDKDEEERESGAESRKEVVVPIEFDFTCSENFTDGVSEQYDYSSAYSELQSEIFPESSEFDFSDYTPSIWYDDSGSQFSDKSINDESPSPTFQLFLQFSQQFCKSNFALETNFEYNDSQDFSLLGLEEEEDEESYKMFRRRERKQVYLHDYAEEYCSNTHYGDLIIQQRLQMVHWIVEQSTNKELQKETLFLGVCLLDRFLSQGYFKTKRNLQLAGIACLTLATRIEENQPFNSVRQKTFYIGSNAYSRCEVVAMEWLVQEVLKFQCFLPSMYNFLWFYLKAARASEKLEKTVKYLAVVALLGHEQLCYWPSTVAAGLVILSSVAANQEASCSSVTETHARIKDDHLSECIKSLAWLVNYIS
ncbi:hypothetical protein ACH5RR_036541 [Cinchona calisaya]|uniref:Cyclin-like domain-containing protein n=1 Tax=Cinchona calisaya TaxID=153742 RepID=A0ABD2Y3H3_9GENT